MTNLVRPMVEASPEGDSFLTGSAEGQSPSGGGLGVSPRLVTPSPFAPRQIRDLAGNPRGPHEICNFVGCRERGPGGEVGEQPLEGGLYLYCVAYAAEKVGLGEIGLEGKEVYTLPFQGLGVVVHRCPAQPYSSAEPKVVEAWVMAHHKVVEVAWERWGTVLPLSFDTIIKGDGERRAEENLRAWLEREYPGLKRQMERVRGKAEYGVQVFWDPKTVIPKVAATGSGMPRLEEAIRSKSRGLAYMYRQKLEDTIRSLLERKADETFKDFYQRIRKHAGEVQVEKIKKAEPGWPMLLNLSCLVARDQCPGLREELDRISLMDGFSVRFTGPWPPYSFVGSGR